MSDKRLLIAAGGTGGHIFPACAAAAVLVERDWSVCLATDARGARHVHEFPGESVIEIRAASPFTKNPVRMLDAWVKLARGVGQAGAILKSYQPDVVVGLGGYPVFPVLTAARLKGVPILVHEQNAVLGRVNRLFARRAAAMASGFGRLDRLPVGARHDVTGNPVRTNVRAARGTVYAPPEPGGEIRILVLGGSLGARVLSEVVPLAIVNLSANLRLRLNVVQQTRAENLDAAREIYAKAGVKAKLSPFFEDIGALYAESHLVISRAGASSVSEIAVIGRPALLVPLAIGADDHQSANAECLVRVGAAEMMAEEVFTVPNLRARLENLLTNGKALADRAEKARLAGRPDAHERLADLIAQVAEVSS